VQFAVPVLLHGQEPEAPSAFFLIPRSPNFLDEADLHRHIHLGTKILFPRAIATLRRTVASGSDTRRILVAKGSGCSLLQPD
jgi:hypothetical protein